MEFSRYLRFVRKWLWLMMLAAILAGGISFIIRTGQNSVYETEATVAIGRYIDAPNPNSADIRTGMDLAQTYAQIVVTHDVLQSTVDALKLPLSVDKLRQLIDTRIISGTSLLVIQVSYTDPVLTADIANALADQLILHSPTNLTEEQQTQLKLANDQISALDKQVAQAREQVAALDTRLAASTDSKEISDLTSQRNALIEQINGAAATIAQFSNTVAALQQRTNALDVVERAQVPGSASGTSVLNSTLLGALAGAVLAVGAALLLEYANDSIPSSERAVNLLNTPVWGTIVRFGKKKDAYPDRLIVNDKLESAVSESYRTLRTNLVFANEDGNRIHIITSPGPIEGKSVTAANLSISLAQTGMRVLLIDADLRRPKVHEIFGVPNDVGLTTLLFSEPDRLDAILSDEPTEDASLRALRNCVRQTGVQNLRVIPCGFIPANPAELLGSALMQRWVEALRASSQVDMVIIDTPPAMVVADASLLAASVKATVVMVVDAVKTRRIAALKTKEQFEQLGVHIKGVVLNRVHPRDEDYGYGYGYAYYYTTPEPNGKAASHGANAGTQVKQR